MARRKKKLKIEGLDLLGVNPLITIEYTDGKSWFTLATVAQLNQSIAKVVQEFNQRLSSLEEKLKS